MEHEGTFLELSKSDNVYSKLLTTDPEIAEEDKQMKAEYKRMTSSRVSMKQYIIIIVLFD